MDLNNQRLSILKTLIPSLKKLGFEVIERSNVCGLHIDLLLKMQAGKYVIVEVKDWGRELSPKLLKKAEKQTQYLKKVTNVDYAFVLLPNLKKSEKNSNIFNSHDLLKFLSWLNYNENRRPSLGSPISYATEDTGEVTALKVFVAMPFDDGYFGTTPKNVYCEDQPKLKVAANLHNCHRRRKVNPPTTGIVTHLAVIYSLPCGNLFFFQKPSSG